MNRTLLTLVIAEAVVIALLAYLWLAGDKTARPPDRREGVEPVAEDGAYLQRPVHTLPAQEFKSDGAAGKGETPVPATDYVVVHGRISSSDGKELEPPVWLNVTKPDGSRQFIQVQPDGHYAVAGLDPGGHTLVASGNAYGETKATLELAGGSTRRDIELTASMPIRIKVVTPEGQPFPVAGVVGVATRELLERLPLTELRGHTRFGVGSYNEAWSMRRTKLPEGVVGVLMVNAPPPFYVNAVFMHFVVAREKVTERVEEITFVLKPEDIQSLMASVKVRVLDADTGKPVTGRVLVSDRQTGASGAVIDADGLAEQNDVPPGLKEFQVWATGYEVVHRYIRLAEPGVLDLGTLRLAKAGEISGEIVDSEGKPAAVHLVVRNLDRMDFPQPLSHAMSHRSDIEGKFKVPGVGRGRYLVVATLKDHALGAVVVDTSGGSVDNVRLRLKKGTPVTLEPEEVGAVHYLITIRRDGVPYATQIVRGEWPLQYVLEPGRYEIEIAVDGVATRTEPLDVGTEPIQRSISRTG